MGFDKGERLFHEHSKGKIEGTLKKKLAVFATHPNQYQAPIWRCLASQPEIQIQVFLGSDFSMRRFWDREFNSQFTWDVPLREGYPHSFLSQDPKVNCPADLKLSLTEIRQRIAEISPDFALGRFIFSIAGGSVFQFFGTCFRETLAMALIAYLLAQVIEGKKV